VTFFRFYKIQFIYDGDMPNHDAPQKLVDAWLEFHRSKLCQSIDAVFVFNNQGVEIWCLSRNEKSYQKLRRLFEPLQASCRIEIYATRPPTEDSAEDSVPPPSLCENRELLDYLHVPFRSQPSAGTNANSDFLSGSEILKQRLISYAERIFAWNFRIKQNATDLPELIQAALDSGFATDLRMHASAVCAAHARDLLENIRKLSKNLVYAFPKSDHKEPVAKTESIKKEKLSVLAQAEDISGAAKELARRVNKFIYPDQYTVDLSDLRQPKILDSLRNLEAVVQNFQKEVSNLPSGHRSL
jgi:hypothetical protein